MCALHGRVPTPSVFFVDVADGKIYMESVESRSLVASEVHTNYPCRRQVPGRRGDRETALLYSWG